MNNPTWDALLIPLLLRHPGNAVGVSPQWPRGQQCPHACTFCYFSSLATQPNLPNDCAPAHGSQTCLMAVHQPINSQTCPMTVHQPTSSQTCPMAVHQPINSQTCLMTVDQPTNSQTCPMTVHQPIHSQTCPLKSGEYLSCCASLYVSKVCLQVLVINT